MRKRGFAFVSSYLAFSGGWEIGVIRLFRQYIPYAVLFLALLDFGLLVLAGELGWKARLHFAGLPVYEPDLLPVLTYAASAQVAAMAIGVYGAESLQSLRYAVARLLVSMSLTVILVSLVSYMLPGSTLWRSSLAFTLFIGFFLLLGVRILLGQMIGGQAFRRRIMVLGAGNRADRIKKLEARSGAGFTVVGYIAMNDGPQVVPESINRDAIYNLADFVVKLGASEVVLALEERRNALPLQDLLRIRTTGVHVNDLSTFLERETGRIDLDSANPSALIFSDGFSAGRRLSSFAKRLFDIFVSTALLLLTAPVILFFALLVKLESKGPAFYRQQRVGLYGQNFSIIKLRSMRQDAEIEGKAVWASEDDPRITRIGRFIRKVRIDELPQAWSVLRGDMSFVGPRPERPEFVSDLETKMRYYAERHMVKPGITGWAQINYPYGASIEDSRHKLEYDLYYAKNYTPFLDLLIILQTLRVILFPSGAR